MNIHQLFEIIISGCQRPAWLPDKAFMEELELFFEPLITVNNFERKQLLLSTGQVAGYIYFLVNGLARGFYTDQAKGKEMTVYLWNRHSIITVPDSFFHQKPSSIFIEVMPHTQLMGISFLNLIESIEVYPEVSSFSKNVIQQYSVYEATRNYELAYLPAWDRYLQLLRTQPDIEQLVSKEIIASFLRIAPQSLSRMLRQKGHP